MHRSKLTNMVIDCPADTYDEAVAFWSRLLGLAPESDGSDRYTKLAGSLDHFEVLLQKVEGQAEVHLDIETDDLDAEVARAETLGAEPKYPIKNWVVMKAPSRHSFCIVKRDPNDPLENPQEWP